jgi:cytochrome c oxidase assembly protein subunit 15
VGFGTAVAMWAVGYVSRLPAVHAPSPLLFALVVACLLGGGAALGRYAGLGPRAGAAAGLVTGTINLLVLGSLLTGEQSDRIVPSALIWLPGSLLVAVALGALGASVGRRRPVPPRPSTGWVAVFVRVAIAAVLLLLVAGGLVTSAEAGLAVVDWPNSFGYNMFLYPLARMTGGIYYEHAHRLFGALVGLTTLVLALLLQTHEDRRWVRRLGWVVWGAVVVQGVLGGLRVTGGFTLSSEPETMSPSLALAMLHGIFGQLVFAALVVLGVFTSSRWRSGSPPREVTAARLDHGLALLLTSLLIGQLILGAAQRHFSRLLVIHIAFGLHTGFRAWAAHERQPLLQRLGIALVLAVALQIGLGFAAYLATLPEGAEGSLLLATAHQGFGAVLLGLSVALSAWSLRLIAQAPSGPNREAPAASSGNADFPG